MVGTVHCLSEIVWSVVLLAIVLEPEGSQFRTGGQFQQSDWSVH